MNGKNLEVLIADLKDRPLRQSHGTEEELKALARSWLTRPVHPVVVRPDLTIADGHRRVRGLKLLGETKLTVFVTDEDLTDEQLTEIGLVTALHRACLEPAEMVRAVAELARADPQLQNKALAARLDLDPSSVTRLLAVARCPVALAALEGGKVKGISEAYAVAKAPDGQKQGLLNLRANGATGHALGRAARDLARTQRAASAVRLARVSVPLSTGTKVVVSGPEMDLETLIEALQSALESARRAAKESLDVKTFEKVARDKAKAGAS